MSEDMCSSSEAGRKLLAECRSPSDFAHVALNLLTSCHLLVQQRGLSDLPSSCCTTPAAPASPASSSQPGFRRFVLSDVEFYHFATESDHPDPFAHAHDSQVNSGTWCFHAAGSGDGFKEGSYKGLDVTFGGAESRSGILIRRMTELGQGASGSVIDGPSLLCDAVLASLRFDKVRDLVPWLRSHPSGCGLDAFHPQSPLRLELQTTPHRSDLTTFTTSPSAPIATSPRPNSLAARELNRIWACPRHGLSLRKATHADPGHLKLRLEYVARPYRFLSARPKNGAINLAYGILQDFIKEQTHAASSRSVRIYEVQNPKRPLHQFGRVIARLMYPELFPEPNAMLTSDTVPQTRAVRAVNGYLEHFQRGLSKHPTAFAGSSMHTTREVGELYGSLLDWDGTATFKDQNKAKTNAEAESALIGPSMPALGKDQVKKRKHEDEDAELPEAQQAATTSKYWARSMAAEDRSTGLSPRALRAMRRG